MPPRSLFPKNLPIGTQMVTVPACQLCHNANEKDDTSIRNLLISTQQSERHPVVIESLAGKRDRSLVRSLQRGRGDFQKLIRNMKIVDVETPARIYLGKAWAFDYDNPLMDRFVERLSRALLWYEFHQPYFVGAFAWRMNNELPSVIYEAIQRFGRVRKVHDVFVYGLTELKDDFPSWVVANFYGSIEFLIRVTKAEQTSGAKGLLRVAHTLR